MHGLSIPTSFSTLELRRKIFSFVVLVFILGLGPSLQADPLQSPIVGMSVEQKVGQIMVWGFANKEFNPELEAMLERYQPGALILFKRNIKTPAQIGKLNHDLQKFASRKLKAPLFLMVDQEGGVVTRVRISPPIPSALALGKTEDVELTRHFSKTKADLLKALNFNVNLAPVLDLSNPLKSSFIGNRALGNDPQIVAQMGMAYSQGMNDGGLMPTAKHFPGHGSLTQDTHKTLAQRSSSVSELENQDLVPFKKFIDATFPRAIMMAHVAVPNLDPSGVPATYSRPMIEDYLRGKLKYEGLVITDDLEMGGAAGIPDIGERAVRAFLAGNDLMIFAGSRRRQQRAFYAMVDAVKKGRISSERLNHSVLRILKAKAEMGLKPTPMNRSQAIKAIKKLEAFSKKVMRKNFDQAVNSRDQAWPAPPPQDRKVAVFSSSGGFYRNFKAHFQGRARIYPLLPETLSGVAEELAKNSVAYGIYYASGHQTSRHLELLRPELKSKLIVVNCNEPASITEQDRYLAVINMNSHSPESGEWLARILSEPNQPELRTPSGTVVDPDAMKK